MLLHLSRAIEAIRKLNKPNNKKIILGTILAPKAALGKGLHKFNGSLTIPLNTTKHWGGIQQALTLIERS
jgi:hypothetical protein